MKRLVAVLIIAVMVLTMFGCSSTVSLSGAQIDDNGHLILSMSDGSTLDAGLVQGEQGIQGEKGEKGDTGAQGPQGEQGENGVDGIGIQKAAVNDKGHLMVRLTDGTLIDTGYVMGSDGADGRDGANGVDGRDGANGSSGNDGADGLTPYIGDNDNWWIGETDTGVKAKDNDFIYNDRGEGTILLAYVGQAQDVVIPAKTTEIGEEAFRENKAVCTVSIPRGVKAIRDYAFFDCDSLESIVLPDGLLHLGEYAFSKCTGLETAYIPKSVVTCPEEQYEEQYYGICRGAFEDCTKLSSVTWGNADEVSPDDTGWIGARMFCNCTSLQNISFPSYLTYIGSEAFMGSGLTGELNLSIPSGDSAFRNTSITSAIVDLCNCPISSNLFAYCYQLQSVTMELNGTELTRGSGGMLDDANEYFAYILIGDSAFAGCESLESVTFPSKTSILVDDWANKYDGALQMANVEVHIRNNAFQGCWSLESISLPQNLTCIYDSAFERSGLKAIVIPSGVRLISDNAFSYCSNLESFYFDGSGHDFSLGKYVFLGCRKLASVTIKGLTYIGNDSVWFSGCANLSVVDLPNIQRIGQNAFLGSGLTSITLPESIQWIDHSIFEATSVATITIKAVNPPNVVDATGTLAEVLNWLPVTVTAIYVPADSVATYKRAVGWNFYTDIIQAIP